MLAVLPLAFVGKFVHAASECVSGSGGYCVNLAAVAQAQGIPGLEFLPATSDFGELISNIYVFGMGLVAISALVVLVAAGVWYMSAGDNAGRAGEAKKWMGNAIFGLVLALLSWLILYTINPDFVAKPSWVQNLQKIEDATPTDPTVIQNSVANVPIPAGVINSNKTIISTGEQFLFKISSQVDINNCNNQGGTVATRPALGVVCVKSQSSAGTSGTQIPPTTSNNTNTPVMDIGSPIKSATDVTKCNAIGQIATCPGKGAICISKGGTCP